MKITITIDESQLNTFLQFLRTLDYVRIEDEENILNAQIEEVQQRIIAHEQGKMGKRPWSEAEKALFSKA